MAKRRELLPKFKKVKEKARLRSFLMTNLLLEIDLQV